MNLNLNGFSILNENNKKCCNNNIKANYSCKDCETTNINKDNIRDSICIPLRLNKIIDSTEVCKHDVGINNRVEFIIDNENISYLSGDKICITNIGLNYDYLGLPYRVITSSQSYIGGELFNLTPEGLFNAGTSEKPYYLFNIMSKNIYLNNDCMCRAKLDNSNQLIRINEIGKYFEVFNMIIVVTGYIGCFKFSARGTILDSSTGHDNIIKLVNLKIISSINYYATVCIPYINSDINITERFEPKLKVDCIRPVQGSLVNNGSLTMFTANVDFSFDVSKKIYFFKKERINVYLVKK